MTDMIDIELIAEKDHPLGGFRLWRKTEDGVVTFAAAIMDDPDTLTDDPRWDLQNWIDQLPDPRTLHFVSAEALYPTYFAMADSHHGAWNVCNHLQDFLPCNEVIGV